MVRGFKETDLDKVMQIWLESNIKEHSFVSKDYWEIASGFVRRGIGASEVYGMDDPNGVGVLTFLREMDMTPEDLIGELPKKDQRLFRKLYAGSFARKLYRLYEYEG